VVEKWQNNRTRNILAPATRPPDNESAANESAAKESAVKILGPAAALIARRADHFRAHLLIETAARSSLQRFLSRWLPQIEALCGPKGLRWSIDVDPLEVD
jgi:primosomal protein N' (replication factor Y)